MIEKSLWHPVLALRDLGTSPRQVQLLGETLVLWRQDTHQVVAMADRCPHRGAPLSMGQVVGGRIECPYHGWQFSHDGACALLPAQGTEAPPAAFRATPHGVALAHGLVWVRLAAGEAAGPPSAVEAQGSGLRRLLCGPFPVATSAPRIVENFLDIAHFGFVHEGSLGDRARTGVPAYSVVPTPEGPCIEGVRVWQPQGHRAAAGGSEVTYRYRVLAPYAAALDKQSASQPHLRDTIALWICPHEAEASTVWFDMAVTDEASSDAALADFQQAIFEQDRPIIEAQRPRRLPLSPGAELHGPADRASVAYRRHLQQRSITFGVC